ncbi:MAG TPA: L-ribulose-5-phosphate 4-epimerase AraD [Patescibacteria group bacterium]|nr:L-ribulose-5-phosphate 4-epimerase AraD [Patescibacteria group bacterium]
MYLRLKKEVCRVNKALAKNGLVLLTWGNASVIDRKKKVIAIKPSGISFDKLTPADIVILDLKGNVIDGKKNPSTDAPTHVVLYESFPQVQSIIHTHSKYATSFAQAGVPIRSFGTTHADHFNGTIPVTRKLSKKEIDNYELNTGIAIAETFKKLDPSEMPACLVVSHGPFIWGKNSEEALENAVILEEIAHMSLNTLHINPTQKDISTHLLNKHYTRKHGTNAYYGQKK